MAIRDIGEIQLSPDGRTLIFTLSTADLATNRTKTEIMLMPVDGATPIPITGLPEGVSSIRWSPDSTRIAFIGSRDGKRAIWTLDMGAKSLTRVCDYDRSNAHLARTGDWIAWSPDSARLAFVGTDEPLERQDPFVTSRIQYKSRTALADDRRVHIFVVSAAGGDPVQLTEGNHDEHSIAWMPSGREIVFVSNREPDPDAVHNYDLFVIDVATRQTRQLTETRGVEMTPRVSPDGRSIAYVATTRPITTIDSVAEDSHVWIVPSEGGAGRDLTKALDRRVLSLGWTGAGDSVLFTVQDQGKTALYRVARDGEVSPVIDKEAQVTSFSASGNGVIAFGLSTPVEPREIYRWDPSTAAPRQLTRINADLVNRWELSKPERIRFRSYDGVEVEGWFYPAVDGGSRPPMLLNIHGGPHGMFGYGFDTTMQAYAGHGYSVLAVNPRGSSGYGQSFSDGSVNNWGGGDYKDLMAAVDHVLKTRTDVDAERLGVTGRSYGGFLTNWVITQTNRFKAAVSIASVANLISFYGTSIYQDLIHAEFGGHPWEGDNFALLWKFSPLAHVRNVTTPTLFIHGEQDNDVHITEPESMYMALRRQGIEAAFARYPREGHGFREPRHRLDYWTRTLAWMDQYLRPTASQARRPMGSERPSCD